jgi:hypothetical protein
LIARIAQFIIVSAAVYYVSPMAFGLKVDAVQAVSITLLAYLFGLVIANPPEINVAVMRAEDFKEAKTKGSDYIDEK